MTDRKFVATLPNIFANLYRCIDNRTKMFIDEYNRSVSTEICHCINSGIDRNNDYLILTMTEICR